MLEGYIYTIGDVGSIYGSYIWVVNVSPILGGCMELIGIWTMARANKSWVDNMTAGGGLLVDIWFFLPKLESYSRLILNDANFSLSLHFINSFSI